MRLHVDRRGRGPRFWSLCAMALWTAGCCLAAHAADPSAQAKYDKDRAACLSGASNQDQATCLKEAGAALQASKQAPLDGQGTDADARRKNALIRCNALPANDRADCVSRIEGDRTTESGSARDGGILRERVTRQPAVPPTQPAAASGT